MGLNGGSNLHVLRALVREKVNDLTGELSDLQKADSDPHVTIVKARVLAKLGFGDRASTSLCKALKEKRGEPRTQEVEKAIGIAGRRFDLDLLGYQIGQGPKSLSSFPKGYQGAIFEHLVALGEFDECARLSRQSGGGLPSLTSLLAPLKSEDALGPIVNAGPSLASVQRAVTGIRGWLSIDEAVLLSALSSSVPHGRDIIEIGSFFGRSTIALATGVHGDGKTRIHAIDPHLGLAGIHRGSTLRGFRRNLRSRGVEERVSIHLAKSVDCAREWRGREVGLLFIDADHSFHSVKEDFESWIPHMTDTGYVAFHDVNQVGPNRLVRTLLRSRHMRPLGLRDSIFVFQQGHAESVPAGRSGGASWVWNQLLKTIHHDYKEWMSAKQAELNSETERLFRKLRIRCESARTSLERS